MFQLDKSNNKEDCAKNVTFIQEVEESEFDV